MRDMGSRISQFDVDKLGRYTDIFPGFAFKSERFTDNPVDVALVKGENVQQGFIDWSASKYWSIVDADSFSKFELRVGDIVLAMDRPWVTAGLKWAYIKKHDPRALLVQRVSRLRAKNGLNQTYLRCLISSGYFSDYIQPIVTGVNVPHISGKQIGDFKIPLPPPPIQQKIAAILSVYDDLIENNHRRIALLEKMAEEIYREWFVRLRFSGHDKVKVIKGVPDGWEIKKLGEILELCYGKALNDDDRVPGEFHVYGSSGVVGTHNEALVKTPGLIVGRKGNVGSVYWSERGFFPIDTVYFVKSELPNSFLYFLLRSMNFINNDAAVPGLNRSQAYSNLFFLPPVQLIKKYEEVADTQFEMKRFLTRQNEYLTLMRDRLLPRLISGKLSVENLDIQFPPGMEEAAHEA